MATLDKVGPIWTVDLGPDENRFSPDWMGAVGGFLKEIARSSEPAVLVTTGSDRFYTNGLDLEWLGAHPDQMGTYVHQVQTLLNQVLTLPVPTVAAINGHAFGAGAMLALAHDYRAMRSDRGYFCLPEVDIHIPFTPGMAALIQAKLSPRAARDTMTTGRRFGGAEAVAAGIVDVAAGLEELPAAAVALVDHLAGKDRDTLGKIKATMYAEVSRALLAGI